MRRDQCFQLGPGNCGGPGSSDSILGILSGKIVRRNRGSGNVKIGFIDFQGLWEGRKTALSFSWLSINRHFHGLLPWRVMPPVVPAVG
jgi:hypothetical protein